MSPTIRIGGARGVMAYGRFPRKPIEPPPPPPTDTLTGGAGIVVSGTAAPINAGQGIAITGDTFPPITAGSGTEVTVS